MLASGLKEKLNRTVGFLKSDLAAVRAGRASVSLVADLPVGVYGTTLTLKELSTLSAPDPQQITVQPWDAGAVAAIEQALRQSELRLNPVVDGSKIRLPIPPLSEERRRELSKLVGQKVEQSRIALRQIRQKARDEVESAEKSKEIGEDEKFRRFKEIEEGVKKANEEIERIGEAKKKEVMGE